MDEHYFHLSAEERAVIMIEHRHGASPRSIGRLLGRNVATLSREVSRNQPDIEVRGGSTKTLGTTLPRRPWPIGCGDSGADGHAR